MKRALTCLMTLLILAMPSFADSLVKVNLIVWAQNNDANNSNQSPSFLAKTPFSGLWLTGDNASPTYRLLTGNQVGFNYAVNNLTQHGYPVLLSLAWYQPSNQPGKVIHIVGGQGFDSTGNPILIATDPHTLPNPSDAAYWQLNGTVQINPAPSHNFNVNLTLTVPSKISSNTDRLASLKSYRLAGKGGLKPNEFSYLGQPLLGVLIYTQNAESKS